MNEIEEKLNKLKESSVKIDAKLKEIKADININDDKYYSMIEELSYGLDSIKNVLVYLREDFDRIKQNLAQHYDGHLPSIKSREQMARAIESLGLSDEYNVEKKTIYAKRNSRGLESFIIKKI